MPFRVQDWAIATQKRPPLSRGERGQSRPSTDQQPLLAR